MAFLASLRDAAEHFSSAANAVQLCAERAHAGTGSADAGATSKPEILALIERVEQAQQQIQTVTEQLLAVAEERLRETNADEDTETEDECESNTEVEILIKLQPSEEVVVKTENPDFRPGISGEGVVSPATVSAEEIDVKQEVGAGQERNAEMRGSAEEMAGGSSQDTSAIQPREFEDELSSIYSFMMYTDLAVYSKKEANRFTTAHGADEVLSYTEDRYINKWRIRVHEYALQANGAFIKYLAIGEVSAEAAERFTDATTLAVALLIRDEPQEDFFLKQFLEDLSHIIDIAKDSSLQRALLPLEKSRNELYSYCRGSFVDSLDDMTSYVSLVKAHYESGPEQQLPPLISLMQKFMWDCISYNLEQNFGGQPRTESQWSRFTEVGLILADWMRMFSSTNTTFRFLSPSLNSTRLDKFDKRFPNRIPQAVFANWRCMVGDSIEVPVSNWPVLKPRKHCVRGITQTARKRVAPSDTNPREMKRVAAGNGGGVALTKAAHHTPLEQFLAAAEEAKRAKHSSAGHQDSTGPSALKNWTAAIKKLFMVAGREFILRVRNGTMDHDLCTGYSEATADASILLLDAIHETKWTSGDDRLKILDSRNALLIHYDNTFQDPLLDIEAHVKSVERKEGEEVWPQELGNIIDTLAEKLSKAGSYVLLRHQVTEIRPWTDEQWFKFIQACWFLMNWTKLVLGATVPPPQYLGSMSRLLQQIEHQHLGRLPRQLVPLCDSMATSPWIPKACESNHVRSGIHAHAEDDKSPVEARAVTRIKRIRPSAVSAARTAATRRMTSEYYKTLTQLHHRWTSREGNAAQPTPAVIQRLLAKAQTMNLNAVEYVKSTKNADEYAMMAFGEATKMLVTCIGRFPHELLPRELMEELLRQQERILDVSATAKAIVPLAAPLTESCVKLREYSAKIYGQGPSNRH